MPTERFSLALGHVFGHRMCAWSEASPTSTSFHFGEKDPQMVSADQRISVVDEVQTRQVQKLECGGDKAIVASALRALSERLEDPVKIPKHHDNQNQVFYE